MRMFTDSPGKRGRGWPLDCPPRITQGHTQPIPAEETSRQQFSWFPRTQCSRAGHRPECFLQTNRHPCCEIIPAPAACSAGTEQPLPPASFPLGWQVLAAPYPGDTWSPGRAPPTPLPSPDSIIACSELFLWKGILSLLK